MAEIYANGPIRSGAGARRQLGTGPWVTVAPFLGLDADGSEGKQAQARAHTRARDRSWGRIPPGVGPKLGPRDRW